MLELELFDICGMDFMRPFVRSYEHKYIFFDVVVALENNEGKKVVAFLRKNIFPCFAVLRTIISDGGSHFCNKMFQAILMKYGVKQHKVDRNYH